MLKPFQGLGFKKPLMLEVTISVSLPNSGGNVKSLKRKLRNLGGRFNAEEGLNTRSFQCFLQGLTITISRIL